MVLEATKIITKDLTIINGEHLVADVNTTTYKKKCIRLDEDSYIMVFTGRRGAGKTTKLTHEAIKANYIYKSKIISNYPIEYMVRRRMPDGSPYLDHIKSEDLDFEKLIMMDEEYNNAIICMDEAPDVISHMASQGWRNRLVNAFIRQLRKKRCTLLLGAQDYELIDKSVRWQVDIEVQCRDASRFIDDPNLLRGSLLWTNWFDHSGNWTNHTTQERINRGVDPCVLRKQVRPCILWGDDTHEPVFDTWRPIDIMESLRKVEIKMSTIQIGDKVNQTMADQYPVEPSALVRALNIFKHLYGEGEAKIYMKEFFTAIKPISPASKNNLGRMLSEYNMERAGNTHKPYFVLDNFDMAGFTDYVMSRQEI